MVFSSKRQICTISCTPILVLGIFFAAFGGPGILDAREFGGQTSVVMPCFNAAIFTIVGPPRGGAYIWTPATKTYPNGPPMHPGQWLLGLSGAPYICLISRVPILVFPGISITMMGSSK